MGSSSSKTNTPPSPITQPSNFKIQAVKSPATPPMPERALAPIPSPSPVNLHTSPLLPTETPASPNHAPLARQQTSPELTQTFAETESPISRKVTQETMTPSINSFFKNSNTSESDYVWGYTAYYDTDAWWFMSPEIAEQVEDLYNNRDIDSNRRISTQYGYFTYDFENMTQRAESTATVRHIARISRDVFQSLYQSYVIDILGREKLWVCRVTDKVFSIYSPELQDKLTQAYKQELTEFSMKLHNSYNYDFDLENSTQCNTSTGKSREIMYIVPSEFEGGVLKGSFGFIYN